MLILNFWMTENLSGHHAETGIFVFWYHCLTVRRINLKIATKRLLNHGVGKYTGKYIIFFLDLSLWFCPIFYLNKIALLSKSCKPDIKQLQVLHSNFVCYKSFYKSNLLDSLVLCEIHLEDSIDAISLWKILNKAPGFTKLSQSTSLLIY